ncbi:hypothetical protein L537_4692 [Bordetella hinzii 1277]|nr:hypothetical protein L537_4692 [Bordetella hinzii 1277]
MDLILKPFGLDALADRVRSLLAETAGCIILLVVNPAFELQCGRQAGACLGRSLREMLG